METKQIEKAVKSMIQKEFRFTAQNFYFNTITGNVTRTTGSHYYKDKEYHYLGSIAISSGYSLENPNERKRLNAYINKQIKSFNYPSNI